MAYRLDDRRPLGEELRRIGDEQLGRALAALDGAAPDARESVHAARKRAKKVRALLRLVRPRMRRRDYRRLNAELRDAARHVSRGRDAAVFPATYDRVRDRFGDEFDRRGNASIRGALTRRAKARAESLGDDGALERLEEGLGRARERLGQIALSPEDGPDGFDAVLPGFVATHDRARAAMRTALGAPSPDTFHEWRKHVKYHRLQLGLLAHAWPGIVGALHDEARRLGDLLGHAHDLVALQTHLAAEPEGLGRPERVEAFVGLAGRLRAELEAEAGPLGRRLFAEKGARVAKRLARWRAVG